MNLILILNIRCWNDQNCENSVNFLDFSNFIADWLGNFEFDINIAILGNISIISVINIIITIIIRGIVDNFDIGWGFIIDRVDFVDGNSYIVWVIFILYNDNLFLF